MPPWSPHHGSPIGVGEDVIGAAPVSRAGVLTETGNRKERVLGGFVLDVCVVRASDKRP